MEVSRYFSRKLIKRICIVFLFSRLALLLIDQWLSVEILNPENISWLLDGDTQNSIGSIHLFRHSPWTFPVGNINSVNLPVGSNILAFDGNLLLGFIYVYF